MATLAHEVTPKHDEQCIGKTTDSLTLRCNHNVPIQGVLDRGLVIPYNSGSTDYYANLRVPILITPPRRRHSNECRENPGQTKIAFADRRNNGS